MGLHGVFEDGEVTGDRLVGFFFGDSVRDAGFASGVEYSAELDRIIPPDAQRGMAARAQATVTEIAGSHAIYVSQPEAVAAAIDRAARSVPDAK